MQINTIVAFVATLPVMALLIRSHPKRLYLRGAKFTLKITW